MKNTLHRDELIEGAISAYRKLAQERGQKPMRLHAKRAYPHAHTNPLQGVDLHARDGLAASVVFQRGKFVVCMVRFLGESEAQPTQDGYDHFGEPRTYRMAQPDGTLKTYINHLLMPC